MRKKILLNKPYFPLHSENKMKHEGDLEFARTEFIKRRSNNLDFLLTTRYDWMNEYTKNKEQIVELGSGAGFSKFFIANKRLRLTDYNSSFDWIDEPNVDALNMPYSNDSIEVIICSHMIHHLATPVKFFWEVQRVLKKNGLLLIHDLNTSLLLRVLLRFMKHEGWSYNIDVFDEMVITNCPEDPWSANCAIPEMLFSDTIEFHKVLPGFKILRNELCECFLFPLSGGVISKTKTINFPKWLLKFVDSIDSLLIKMFPNIFALGRKVVIQKR